MSEKPFILLETVAAAELPQFVKKLQQAFSVALLEKFGDDEVIPAEDEIRASFSAKGAESYHLVADGMRVGGAILKIDSQTQRNALELFFISPQYHSRGLGLAAWKAIEARYPDTVVWETITPYFEERNIHFYVNKCGFHIVEFFNPHHVDPHQPRPQTRAGGPLPGEDLYFRFEKVMQ